MPTSYEGGDAGRIPGVRGACLAPWAGFQLNRASRCWHHQPPVWGSLGWGPREVGIRCKHGWIG